MTKTHFSTLNRKKISTLEVPKKHKPRAIQLWILIMHVIYAYYSWITNFKFWYHSFTMMLDFMII